MPTGVTVSHKGRIFVNFPKWGDDVKFTVAEIQNGQPIAYPDESINEVDQEIRHQHSVVQSVVVDPADVLWILDTGVPIQAHRYGGPKLICVNLDTNKVVKRFYFLKQLLNQPLTSMIFALIYAGETTGWHLLQIHLKRDPMQS